MRSVFVDTGAIHALFDTRDTLHRVAKEVLEYLTKENFSLISTRWVEYEALSHLKPLGIDVCNRYVKLRKKMPIEIADVDESLEQEALQLFWTYSDKTWGIVDCVSIALMYRRNMYYAFTSDQHFQEAGFFRLIENRDGTGIRTFLTLT